MSARFNGVRGGWGGGLRTFNSLHTCGAWQEPKPTAVELVENFNQTPGANTAKQQQQEQFKYEATVNLKRKN